MNKIKIDPEYAADVLCSLNEDLKANFKIISQSYSPKYLGLSEKTKKSQKEFLDKAWEETLKQFEISLNFGSIYGEEDVIVFEQFKSLLPYQGKNSEEYFLKKVERANS